MKNELITLTVALAAGLVPSAQAAPGDLDPSFGSGGLATADFGGRGDFGLAVALQPDGKIVSVGNSSTSSPFSLAFALSRHNPDGTLDPTFGNGGTVLTSFGTANSAGSDVAIQPDGRIVAVGFAGGDFGVARYLPDGALDTGFGTGGLVTTDFGGFDQANGVALQPDGKIVVVGPLQGAVGVARYNPNGSLDTAFGTSGKVVTDATPSFDGAFDVAVAATGAIVVGGGTGLAPLGTSDFLILRYRPDGSLDPSFGTGGIVTTDFGGGDIAFAIGLAAGGKITTAGGTNVNDAGDFAVAQYNTDGSPDVGFGSGGVLTTDVTSGSHDTGNGVVVLADGRVAVAGISGSAPGSTVFALVRYSAAGAVDTTFGSGGRSTASFGNPVNNAFDVAAQPDGKFVVVGGTADFSRGVSDFALARFLGDPTAVAVEVDVKPGDPDNVVPLQANGVIPVAILTTNAFDATSVDPASVCFVHSCVEKHGFGHLEDVNGDGRRDLLLHYEAQTTGIAAGDTQACLTGKTSGGVAVRGCDRITAR
jgi:uncharacterized delta-60 repeat protein